MAISGSAQEANALSFCPRLIEYTLSSLVLSDHVKIFNYINFDLFAIDEMMTSQHV